MFAALYLVGKYRHFKELNGYCNDSLRDIDAFMQRKYNAILSMAQKARGVSAEAAELADELEKNPLREHFSVDDCLSVEEWLEDCNETLTEMLNGRDNLLSTAAYHEYATNVRASSTDILNAKEVYNETAAVYNRSIVRFPGSLLARALKLRKKNLFIMDSDI